MATFNLEEAYNNDYQWFDGVDTLSYKSKNPDATSILGSVKAVREPMSQDPIGGGDFGSDTKHTVFHVWDSTLGQSDVGERDDDIVVTRGGAIISLRPTVVPKNGDWFTDNHARGWMVLDVTENGREPRWRLSCTEQRSNG